MKLKYDRGSIEAGEVLKHLILTGQASLLREIIGQKEAARQAEELNLEVSDTQLQEFADNFRMALGLYSAQETYDYLQSRGLSEGDFEQYCETTLLVDMLKERLSDEKKIRDYFINNRSRFDRARISVIVVSKEELANELLLRIEEDGEDFHDLAGRYSKDASTRFSGGHAGLVSRSMLTAEVMAKVFNARRGEIVGPFEKDGNFSLIQVEEVFKAELTEEIQTQIKERLFEHWMRSLFKKGFKITE